jgi:hypothetical protein
MSATVTTARPAASVRRRSASGLAAKPPRLTAVAWAPEHELAHQQWLAEGKRVGAVARGSAWWVGDWLLYGAARWGERYAEASRVTGYDPKTLRNMRYVASRFHLSLRRDKLTFSHHALVAGLEPDAQCHWLDRATHDRMSVEDLRIELRTARRQSRASDSDLETSAPASVIPCPHCGEGIPMARAARP